MKEELNQIRIDNDKERETSALVIHNLKGRLN